MDSQNGGMCVCGVWLCDCEWFGLGQDESEAIIAYYRGWSRVIDGSPCPKAYHSRGVGSVYRSLDTVTDHHHPIAHLRERFNVVSAFISLKAGAKASAATAV